MKSRIHKLIVSLFLVSGFVISTSFFQKEPLENKLSLIELPKGFKIEVYAKDIPNARSMALSENGILFVGTRSDDKVYALIDSNGDNIVDKKYTIASGLKMPNGVALQDGDLYVAEVNRILRFPNAESSVKDNMTFEVVYDEYPSEKHHGWKYITFGPDGMLYVPVGAPCNICNKTNPIYASITKIDVNSENPKPVIIQRGVRNTVGITFHPETKEMWFTDNGRDMMGDDMPRCELNKATKENLHFGYPFCHQGDVPDPEFGKGVNCNDYTAPFQKLGPHVAPLGLTIYHKEQFPENYKNMVFIAEHGSWNRSVPIGYRISIVDSETKSEDNYEIFAQGWLQNGKPWGRPVDIKQMKDGSILVSDDFAGAIYRISYKTP